MKSLRRRSASPICPSTLNRVTAPVDDNPSTTRLVIIIHTRDPFPGQGAHASTIPVAHGSRCRVHVRRTDLRVSVQIVEDLADPRSARPGRGNTQAATQDCDAPAGSLRPAHPPPTSPEVTRLLIGMRPGKGRQRGRHTAQARGERRRTRPRPRPPGTETAAAKRAARPRPPGPGSRRTPRARRTGQPGIAPCGHCLVSISRTFGAGCAAAPGASARSSTPAARGPHAGRPAARRTAAGRGGTTITDATPQAIHHLLADPAPTTTPRPRQTPAQPLKIPLAI